MPQANDSAEVLSLKFIASIDSIQDFQSLEKEYRTTVLPQIASPENEFSKDDIDAITDCYNNKKIELTPKYFLGLIHFSESKADLEKNYREIILPAISKPKNNFSGNDISAINEAYKLKKSELSKQKPLHAKNSQGLLARKNKKQKTLSDSKQTQYMSINTEEPELKKTGCPCPFFRF